jgi:pyruvate kinase
MKRRAKIVATLGPACDQYDMLERLVLAGVNVVRLNFSHGTHEQHGSRIAAIRSISERLNISVGILQDLQGPKIRIGKLPSPIQLYEGQHVTLYTRETNRRMRMDMSFRSISGSSSNPSRPGSGSAR